MFFSTENGSGSTSKTKVLCFHIYRLQTAPNKQVLKNWTFFLPWQLAIFDEAVELPFFTNFFTKIIPGLYTMILLCVESSLSLLT